MSHFVILNYIRTKRISKLTFLRVAFENFRLGKGKKNFGFKNQKVRFSSEPQFGGAVKTVDNEKAAENHLAFQSCNFNQNPSNLVKTTPDF